MDKKDLNKLIEAEVNEYQVAKDTFNKLGWTISRSESPDNEIDKDYWTVEAQKDSSVEDMKMNILVRGDSKKIFWAMYRFLVKGSGKWTTYGKQTRFSIYDYDKKFNSMSTEDKIKFLDDEITKKDSQKRGTRTDFTIANKALRLYKNVGMNSKVFDEVAKDVPSKYKGVERKAVILLMANRKLNGAAPYFGMGPKSYAIKSAMDGIKQSTIDKYVRQIKEIDSEKK